eukprot:m.203347 g.203347  ORF g.203347 m.203347 type:complete len:655 (-) comp22094_c0_seq1:86-2050(-)
MGNRGSRRASEVDEDRDIHDDRDSTQATFDAPESKEQADDEQGAAEGDDAEAEAEAAQHSGDEGDGDGERRSSFADFGDFSMTVFSTEPDEPDEPEGGDNGFDDAAGFGLGSDGEHAAESGGESDTAAATAAKDGSENAGSGDDGGGRSEDDNDEAGFAGFEEEARLDELERTEDKLKRAQELALKRSEHYDKLIVRNASVKKRTIEEESTTFGFVVENEVDDIRKQFMEAAKAEEERRKQEEEALKPKMPRWKPRPPAPPTPEPPEPAAEPDDNHGPVSDDADGNSAPVETGDANDLDALLQELSEDDAQEEDPAWLHADMTKPQAEDALSADGGLDKEGHFLVRPLPGRETDDEFVVSVVFRSMCTHHMLKMKPSQAELNGAALPDSIETLEEVVEFLRTKHEAPMWPLELTSHVNRPGLDVTDPPPPTTQDEDTNQFTFNSFSFGGEVESSDDEGTGQDNDGLADESSAAPDAAGGESSETANDVTTADTAEGAVEDGTAEEPVPDQHNDEGVVSPTDEATDTTMDETTTTPTDNHNSNDCPWLLPTFERDRRTEILSANDGLKQQGRFFVSLLPGGIPDVEYALTVAYKGNATFHKIDIQDDTVSPRCKLNNQDLPEEITSLAQVVEYLREERPPTWPLALTDHVSVDDI